MVQISELLRWYLVLVLGEGGPNSSNTVGIRDQVDGSNEINTETAANAILRPVLRVCLTNEDNSGSGVRNATEDHASSPCAGNSTLYLRIDVAKNHFTNATNVTSPDKISSSLQSTNNSSSDRVLLLDLIRETIVAIWKTLLRTETVRAFELADDRLRSDDASDGIGIWDVLRSTRLIGNSSDSRYDASRQDKDDSADEILVVGDNSYMSVSNYRSSVLPILVAPVLRLPCPSGLRMPNSTDCFKYYVCNATRGQLFTFSCPRGMAFNAVERVCDVQSAKSCVRNVSGDVVVSSTTNSPISELVMCTKNGKIPDPESPRNYYVCVTRQPSEPFRKLKFSCPEGLVFCNRGKVCKEAAFCPNDLKDG